MEFKKSYLVAIGVALFLLAFAYLAFWGSVWFIPSVVISITLGWLPFWIDFFIKLQRQKELESRFPEFVRNLVGAIKSGMPAPRAIIHIATLDYGALNPHVKKLANQLEWAIPLRKALENFAIETKNDVIRRAVSSVVEAEQSGGNIEDVLESITQSVIEIKTLKQKRKAAINSQVIQSYIIFIVFVGVMIVIQNLLIPYMTKLESAESSSGIGGGLIRTGLGGLTKQVSIDTNSIEGFFSSIIQWVVSLQGVFLMLALIQSFFAGIVVGKLSEGDVTSGIKHSFIMMTISFFLIMTAQGFL